MSEGLQLLGSILDAGSVGAVRDLDSDLFIGDEETEAFRFIQRHVRRYAALPNVATLEDELDIGIPDSPEPADFYLEQVFDRRMFNGLREPFSALREALTERDMEAARGSIDRLSSQSRVFSPNRDLLSIGEAGALAVEEYEQAHMNPGITGVATGWPRFDENTGGFQSGDLIVFAARPGMGKTYLLIRMAMHAWLTGQSILFTTMEMTLTQIARRFLAMRAGVNPSYILKGCMSTWAQHRYIAASEELEDCNRFQLYAGNFSKNVSQVEMLSQELRPDIIMIDGMYLMKPTQRNNNNKKTEDVSLVTDELKQMTVTANRPVVATTQFNRASGRGGKMGSLETIGYTDAIGTHASLIYRITEAPAPNPSSTRVVEAITGREGESGRYGVRYSFSPMNFDEVSLAEGSDGQTDDVDLDWMDA